MNLKQNFESRFSKFIMNFVEKFISSVNLMSIFAHIANVSSFISYCSNIVTMSTFVILSFSQIFESRSLNVFVKNKNKTFMSYISTITKNVNFFIKRCMTLIIAYNNSILKSDIANNLIIRIFKVQIYNL